MSGREIDAFETVARAYCAHIGIDPDEHVPAIGNETVPGWEGVAKRMRGFWNVHCEHRLYLALIEIHGLDR